MALKIKTREEAIAVLRDMVRRKKEMEAKAQIDFAKAREEAADCYVIIALKQYRLYHSNDTASLAWLQVSLFTWLAIPV